MKYKITREMLVKKFKIPKHARIKFVGKFWDEAFDDKHAGIMVSYPDGKAK